MARRPRTIALAPRAWQKSTVRPSKASTRTLSSVGPAPSARAARMTSMRVSTGSSGVFRGLARTPMMTVSKTAVARATMSRWPLVIGIDRDRVHRSSWRR
jgi:hypothetical protein